MAEKNTEKKSPQELDEKTKQQIQELQILEQNFQQLLMQKQAFQIELNETDRALEELKKAKGDVFKIVASQIVLKTSKPELEKETKHKKELVELRLKNINSQEKQFSDKIQKIRDEIMKKISNK
jgi:prefoldin beta subunit